uniref:Uncharacterized protein n=1 Tax=Gracilinema caldarium TaxID=215591 RepID=A0A7C3ILA1_9SPIR
MSLSIYTLDLRAPFIYTQSIAEDPFGQPPHEEAMACFSLDRDVAQSIEPDAEHYLGPLLFRGTKSSEAPDTDDCVIPKGLYLFAQIREAPQRDLFTAMAIEVQKEGLWRRMEMENRVFIRILKEEDEVVTQVLRPISAIPDQA